VFADTDVDELELDAALQQVVLRLQRHDRCQAELLGQQRGLLQLPADEVADSDVLDLARADRIVEEPQRLLDRGQRVPGVRLVQVDGLDAEPPQARVQCLGQADPGQSDVVRPVTSGEAALGGDHHLVTGSRPGREPAPDAPLRLAVRVDIGGVEEVAALLQEAVELGGGDLLVALGPERHRAQAQRGHDRAGVPERPVLHRCTPPSRRSPRQPERVMLLPGGQQRPGLVPDERFGRRAEA
jgi:hypothetical protein